MCIEKDPGQSRSLARVPQLAKEIHRLFPQETDSVFVTFTVKSHLRRTVQVEIRPGDLQDLADPGAGIVEEQKQSSVSDSEQRV